LKNISGSALRSGRLIGLGKWLNVNKTQKRFFVYMLECADESYYIGMTTSLEKRLAEHEAGIDPYAYTYSRRPVTLVWNQAFDTEHEAFLAERQLKGWSRAKKQALSKDDWNAIHQIVMSERKRRERSKVKSSIKTFKRPERKEPRKRRVQSKDAS